MRHPHGTVELLHHSRKDHSKLAKLLSEDKRTTFQKRQQEELEDDEEEETERVKKMRRVASTDPGQTGRGR